MELGNNLEAWVRDNNWESMAGAVVELIEATRA
jgi:D-tyrosyl-tRNA(Tyr) deacylase